MVLTSWKRIVLKYRDCGIGEIKDDSYKLQANSKEDFRIE